MHGKEKDGRVVLKGWGGAADRWNCPHIIEGWPGQRFEQVKEKRLDESGAAQALPLVLSSLVDFSTESPAPSKQCQAPNPSSPSLPPPPADCGRGVRVCLA